MVVVKRLTQTLVDGLAVGETVKGIHWSKTLKHGDYVMCGRMPWFGVRVGRKAHKYVTRYQRKTHVLGPITVYPVREALLLHQQRMQELLSGVPIIKSPGRVPGSHTVRQMAEAWNEWAADNTTRVAAQNDESAFRRYIVEHEVPEHYRSHNARKVKLGDLDVLAVQAGHLMDVHKQATKTYPIAANNAVKLFSKAFNHVLRLGWWEHNPVNPVTRMPKYWQNSEGLDPKHMFTVPELQAIARALDRAEEEGEISLCALNWIWTLWWTGARTAEPIQWRMDNIDWETGYVIQETAKGDRKGRKGKGRVFLLTAELLQRLQRYERRDSPWVFPRKLEHRQPRHRTSIAKPFAAIMEMAGIEKQQPDGKVVPYSFRVSASNRAKRLMPEDHRLKLLGHGKEAAKYYDHFQEPEVIESMSKYHDWLRENVINDDRSDRSSTSADDDRSVDQGEAGRGAGSVH